MRTTSFPFGISQNALAHALGISPQSIKEIVLGRRCITPKMSLKLGKFFKQSAQFWFNIQTTCDFRQLRKKENQITSSVAKDYTELSVGIPPTAHEATIPSLMAWEN